MTEPGVMGLSDIAFAALRGATPVARRSLAHGPRHWRDVARLGLTLSADVECDVELAYLFAIFHDTQRHDEFEDPDHGARAATFLLELRRSGALELSSERARLLSLALAEHNWGETTDDPTIGVCWDADRLTLCRLGEVCSPGLLSTDAARDRLELGGRTVFGPDVALEEIVAGYEAAMRSGAG